MPDNMKGQAGKRAELPGKANKPESGIISKKGEQAGKRTGHQVSRT